MFYRCGSHIYLYYPDEELAEIERERNQGLDRIATERDRELADIQRRRTVILSDLDYLKKNKIRLLREGSLKPEEVAEESENLTKQLEELDVKVSAYTASESEMLDYVINFSKLIQTATDLFKEATDSERLKLTSLVFSKLTLSNGKLVCEPTESFAPLYNRPIGANGGAVGTNIELANPKKVEPLEQSEKLIDLRNSLDFVKNILKSPEAQECILTL